MRRLRFSLVSLLVLGCGIESESETDPCGIVGRWSATLTVGNGTCFESGSKLDDTLSLTLVGDRLVVQAGDGSQPDVGSFDPNTCAMVMVSAVNAAETEMRYEMRGTDTSTLRFDGGKLNGTSSLEADLYEAGSKVGSCSQSGTVTGHKL